MKIENKENPKDFRGFENEKRFQTFNGAKNLEDF